MAKKRREKERTEIKKEPGEMSDGKDVLLKILVQFIPLIQRVLFSHSLAN